MAMAKKQRGMQCITYPFHYKHILKVGLYVNTPITSQKFVARRVF